MSLVNFLKNHKRKLAFLISSAVLISGIYAGLIYFRNNPPYNLVVKCFTRLSPYTIDRAEVDIEFLPEEEELKMSSNMDIKSGEPVKSLFVFALSDGLEIENAWINDQEVNVYRIWLVNFIFLPQQVVKENNKKEESFQFKIKYSGFPTGFSKKHAREQMQEDFVYIDANALYCPTVGGIRKHTEDIRGENTSLVKMNLISSEDIQGITAGRLAAKNKINDKVQYSWKYKSKNSFAQVVFGRYAESKDDEIRVFCPKKNRDYPMDIIKIIREIKNKYEKELGRGNCDYLNVVILPVNHGGFFHHGMITIGENRIKFELDHKTGVERPDYSFYSLLAHEVGHSYWSNSDNPGSSSGQQWYVEGFTEYASEWVTAQEYGMAEYVESINSKISYLKRRENYKPLTGYTYWEYSTIPYYKGTLMLEGLRRMEGERKVLKFMNEMRKISKECKGIKELTASAEKVFNRDYRLFFEHWLEDQKPVSLSINSMIWGENSLEFDIISSHTLEFPLEIMLSGLEGRKIIKRNIKKGQNKIEVTTNDLLTHVFLDPHRKVFSLEDMFDYPKVERSLPVVNTAELEKYYGREDVDDYTFKEDLQQLSFAEIEKMSDKWIEVNQNIKYNGELWCLEKIMADFNSYWGIFRKISDTNNFYPDFGLWEENYTYFSRNVYRNYRENKILINWYKFNETDEYYAGGRTVNIGNSPHDFTAEAGEKSIEIKMPLQEVINDEKYFLGRTFSFSYFDLKIDKVIFHELAAEVKFSVVFRDDCEGELLNCNVYPVGADDSFRLRKSSSTKSDRTIYTLTIPFLERPFPLKLKIGGIRVKRRKEIIPEYLPGGEAWIALKDKTVNWSDACPGRINLVNDQELLFDNFNLLSDIGGRNISMEVRKNSKQKNRLYLVVNGEPGDMLRVYLNNSRGAEKSFYREVKIKNNTAAVLINPEKIENGWYNLNVEIAGIGGIEIPGYFLIYEPKKLQKQEKKVRRQLKEVIGFINYNEEISEEYFNDDYKPFWYERIQQFRKKGKFEINIKDVHPGSTYHNKMKYIYKVELTAGSIEERPQKTIVDVEVIVGDDGNINLR